MTPDELEKEQDLAQARARRSSLLELLRNPVFNQLQDKFDDGVKRAIKTLANKKLTPEQRSEAVDMYAFALELSEWTKTEMDDCRRILGIHETEE